MNTLSFRKANVADGCHLEFQKVIIIQSWTEILACNFARWLILPVETTPSGTFCFHIDTFPIQLLSTVYTKKLRWTIYLWSGFRNGFRFLTIKRATINVFAPNFVQWRKINTKFSKSQRCGRTPSSISKSYYNSVMDWDILACNFARWLILPVESLHIC